MESARRIAHLHVLIPMQNVQRTRVPAKLDMLKVAEVVLPVSFIDTSFAVITNNDSKSVQKRFIMYSAKYVPLKVIQMYKVLTL